MFGGSSFVNLFEEISFRYHKELNQKLFNGDVLKPEVRLTMLEFAHEWSKFVNIPFKLIKDVYFLGSNANFNYNPTSDIDIHLIIVQDEIKKHVLEEDNLDDLINDYFQNKKSSWTSRYKEINIDGLPLEPYVQDIKSPMPEGQGVYSLLKGKWVNKPEYNPPEVDEIKLSSEASHIENIVNNLINIKADPEKVKEIGDKLWKDRQKSLPKEGEFSFATLLFKELRSRGLFDKMNKYTDMQFQKRLSLEEDAPATNTTGMAAYDAKLGVIVKRKKNDHF